MIPNVDMEYRKKMVTSFARLILKTWPDNPKMTPAVAFEKARGIEKRVHEDIARGVVGSDGIRRQGNANDYHSKLENYIKYITTKKQLPETNKDQRASQMQQAQIRQQQQQQQQQQHGMGAQHLVQQPSTPRPAGRKGKRRSLPEIPTSRTPRRSGSGLVALLTDRVIRAATVLPALDRWRRQMVGEELSRRRILVWLQERRIKSAEHFRRTMIEFCEQDDDLTYLRVKKKLVTTFGIVVFAEHKEVVRDYLGAVALTGSRSVAVALTSSSSTTVDEAQLSRTVAALASPSPSSSRSSSRSSSPTEPVATVASVVTGGGATPTYSDVANADADADDSGGEADMVVACDEVTDLMDHVRFYCSPANKTGSPNTYLRLKAELIERFGSALVQQHMGRKQQYMQSKVEDLAGRLQRRVQVHSDIVRRLATMVGNESLRDERQLLSDQLTDLETEIGSLREAEAAAALLAAPACEPMTLDRCAADILCHIFSMLPTQTLLVAIARVCKKFRALLPQMTAVALRLGWARLVLTDRVMLKFLVPCVGQLGLLNLAHCDRLTDKGCAAVVTRCAELTDLNLTSCAKITDEGLEAFARSCPLLSQVTLYDCAVSGSGIALLLRSCSLLRSLDLGRSLGDCASLEAADVQLVTEALGVNPRNRLTCLSLERATATPDMFAGLLQRLPCLTAVNLGHTTLSDVGVGAVSGLVGLRDCRLPGNRTISDAAVAGLLKACPRLELLDVAGCSALTDGALVDGVAAVESLALVSLSLSHCHITDRGLSVLADKARGLRILDLGYCDAVTDGGVVLAAGCCRQLANIDLRCCFLITSASLAAIGEHCDQIVELNFQGCNKVEDFGVEALARGCAKLVRIDLSRCKAVTDTAVDALLTGCRGLEGVLLDGCPDISDELRYRLPNCLGT